LPGACEAVTAVGIMLFERWFNEGELMR